ncbi:MAG: hypothetical protein K2P99_04725 [Burkholderiales bacterium]|nr:hypothetical protein [Burkholderiales bacterium]
MDKITREELIEIGFINHGGKYILKIELSKNINDNFTISYELHWDDFKLNYYSDDQKNRNSLQGNVKATKNNISQLIKMAELVVNLNNHTY